MSVRIIHKNDDFVVAVKPYGVLSERDDARENMVAELSRTLGVPPEHIYPVHRLDATTAGLIVYALTKDAAAKLSATIAGGGFRKEYIAFVTDAEVLAPSGEMRDFLFFDKGSAKSFVVKENKKGAKEARLEYTLLDGIEWRGVTVTPVKIKLHTGRTHQIRAQFSSRGCPLIGDGKYGSRINYKRPALVSCAISFELRGNRESFELDDLAGYYPEESRRAGEK